ncbi:MAG: phosphoglycerate kinase [Alphaproteobacteria bacterium]
MQSFRGLDDLDPGGKRILLRLDLNVPLKDGQVSDDSRIRRSLASVLDLARRGGRVIILSHLGRPAGADPALSLRPVATALERCLRAAGYDRPVAFAADCIGAAAQAAVAALGDGDVLLLENLRFHKGEEANATDFTAALARLGEIWVMDAFSAAHRAHGSTAGLAAYLPAFAGRLMAEELAALNRVLATPERPLAAVIGGAKVSSKIDVLRYLVERVQVLVIGGAMANTFLLARGHAIGRSLAEPDLVDVARDIERRAREGGGDLLLPDDVVVAPGLDRGNAAATVKIDQVPAAAMILDFGVASAARLCASLADWRTLVWNGPLGAFEHRPFDQATLAFARAVAQRTRDGALVSVAGGGDTVAALNAAGVSADLSYVSTAGGAFLEWLEGRTLPGVAALAAAAR